MSSITVSITLTPAQARAYRRWLALQYELTISEVWHCDRYRYVPEERRGPRVLQDYPRIAGISRTLRELHKLLQVREDKA